MGFIPTLKSSRTVARFVSSSEGFLQHSTPIKLCFFCFLEYFWPAQRNGAECIRTPNASSSARRSLFRNHRGQDRRSGGSGLLPVDARNSTDCNATGTKADSKEQETKHSDFSTQISSVLIKKMRYWYSPFLRFCLSEFTPLTTLIYGPLRSCSMFPT